MWAPAVTEKGGKYYFFFGANDIHDDVKQVGGIGVGVADNPAGPFKDYLGKPLIGKIYNKAQPIDQFVFTRIPMGSITLFTAAGANATSRS